MINLKTVAAAAVFALGLATSSLPAAACGMAEYVWYNVNGETAPEQWVAYLSSQHMPAGDYWVDEQGNWGKTGEEMTYGNINADQLFADLGTTSVN
jgi:hypothetical protein